MENVSKFILTNWHMIVLISFLLINLMNAITNHFSDNKGLQKVGLIITQFLSFVVSKDENGKFKLPGMLTKKTGMSAKKDNK